MLVTTSADSDSEKPISEMTKQRHREVEPFVCRCSVACGDRAGTQRPGASLGVGARAPRLSCLSLASGAGFPAAQDPREDEVLHKESSW